MQKIIAQREFDVPRLNRAQLRELSKQGCDLMQKAMTMLGGGAEGGVEIPFNIEESDKVLDIAFPGRDEDLEVIGLSGRVELLTQVLHETFGDVEQEEKN